MHEKVRSRLSIRRVVMQILVASAAVLAGPVLAQAGASAPDTSPSNLLTRPSSLLCASPHHVAQATEAAIRGEYQRLSGLGCHFAKAGLPAIRITDVGPRRADPVWQVRLQLRDGNGATVWGSYYAFTAADGALLGPDGSRRSTP
jgi:hypothetical protein